MAPPAVHLVHLDVVAVALAVAVVVLAVALAVADLVAVALALAVQDPVAAVAVALGLVADAAVDQVALVVLALVVQVGAVAALAADAEGLAGHRVEAVALAALPRRHHRERTPLPARHVPQQRVQRPQLLHSRPPGWQRPPEMLRGMRPRRSQQATCGLAKRLHLHREAHHTPASDSQ